MTVDEDDDDAINPYGYDLLEPRKGGTDQVRELVFVVSTIIHATQAGRIGTLDPNDPDAPTTLETLHHTHSEYQLAQLLLRGSRTAEAEESPMRGRRARTSLHPWQGHRMPRSREAAPRDGLPATSTVSALWNVVPVPLVSVTQPCMSVVAFASSYIAT